MLFYEGSIYYIDLQLLISKCFSIWRHFFLSICGGMFWQANPKNKRWNTILFVAPGTWWHEGLPGSSSDSGWRPEPKVWHHYQKSPAQVSRFNSLKSLLHFAVETVINPSSPVGSWLNAGTVNQAVFHSRWPLLNLRSQWTRPPCLPQSSPMASMLLSWGLLQVGCLYEFFPKWNAIFKHSQGEGSVCKMLGQGWAN